MKDNVKNLTKLGSKETKYQYDKPNPDLLETFQNKYPGKGYIVEFTCDEFTSLCPKTGQPDFATIEVQYVPHKLCIETKSLKLYLMTFRQEGSFMETLTNKILEDLVKVCEPEMMTVIGKFNSRGGIKIKVIAKHYSNRE